MVAAQRAIVGATVIDGTGRPPINNAVVVVEGERIQAVAPAGDMVPVHAEVMDATGRYLIPGLMDANVHLYGGLTPDLLLGCEGRYADLIAEAAKVTLCAGVTTVFDTWGPIGALVAVRDRIQRGEISGSRIFLAGNIVGLGGPLSADFFPTGNVFGRDTVNRINQHWEAGVGADLLWLTPQSVGERVRQYIERFDVDFIKYSGSGHGQLQYIAFSAEAQRAIVDEAHRAGLTVQAHTTTVESLRMEIEAGADILQHGDLTGPEPIPDETLKTIVDRAVPVAALVCTDAYLDWVATHGNERIRREIYNKVKDDNDRRLIDAGAKLLLTTDGTVLSPHAVDHPMLAPMHKGAVESPMELGESHFLWLEAVVDRGMAPMDALLAGTRNIAEAYGQADHLGTLEPGKRADLVILEGNPLDDVRNYRRISAVMKDGALVDQA